MTTPVRIGPLVVQLVLQVLHVYRRRHAKDEEEEQEIGGYFGERVERTRHVLVGAAASASSTVVAPASGILEKAGAPDALLASRGSGQNWRVVERIISVQFEDVTTSIRRQMAVNN